MPTPSTDSGVDSGFDASVMDASFDAMADAGIDAAVDAGADAGVDAAIADAGDAGLGDAGLGDAMIPGYGVIGGDCFLLGPELRSTQPSYYEHSFDFGTDVFDEPADRSQLTAGAARILMEGTAGGSSGLSEALAFEALARCEGATFGLSETAVEYDSPTSKKTDIVVDISGVRLGVSVVRAVRFPETQPYTVEDALIHIRGKLEDILISSMHELPPATWHKQILAVLAWDEVAAQSVRMAWEMLPSEVRADTILFVMLTNGADRPIYFSN